jgi:hypothetical protein
VSVVIGHVKAMLGAVVALALLAGVAAPALATDPRGYQRPAYRPGGDLRPAPNYPFGGYRQYSPRPAYKTYRHYPQVIVVPPYWVQGYWAYQVYGGQYYPVWVPGYWVE